MSKLPTHKPHRPDHAEANAQAKARQSRRYLRTDSARWRKIRAAQLEQFPLCEDCRGVATEVDHNTNDTSRNIIGIELSSLCKPCHSSRTRARQMGMEQRQMRGCDVHGYPLDPAHHWNAEKSLAPVAPQSASPALRAPPRIVRIGKS